MIERNWICKACKRPRQVGDGYGPLKDTLIGKYKQGKCKGCRGAMRFFEQEQPLVWNPEAGRAERSGEELKQEGIAKVEQSSGNGIDAAWKQSARAVAMGLITQRREFTMDDITSRAGLPTQRNLTGAFLNGLAREGLIKRVGYRKGARSEQHSRMVAVWVAK